MQDPKEEAKVATISGSGDKWHCEECKVSFTSEVDLHVHKVRLHAQRQEMNLIVNHTGHLPVPCTSNP